MLDGRVLLLRQQGQQRLGQAGQVPQRDAWLVAEGIAPGMVDGAEHRPRVIGVQEGAGPEIDRLAGDGHVVGVHHAMDETDQHPARHQLGLRRADGFEQCEIGVRRLGGLRVMAGDDVVGECLDRLQILAGGEILEGADADMAGGDAGQHPARQGCFAEHMLAGRDRRQRPCGRDAEGVHRLRDDVFAQHRPERGAPIPTAREGGGPRALELDVPPRPVPPDHLAQQDGAAIAELGDEIAELVAGIGLGEGLRALGHRIAREHRDAFGGGQPGGVEAELLGQRMVQPDQLRCLDWGGRQARVEAVRQAGVAVVEGDAHGVLRVARR